MKDEYVPVLCRNRRLFHCVRNAVSLNFGSYVLGKLIRYSCIYEACEPRPYWSSAVWRFEQDNAIEIHNRISFPLYGRWTWMIQFLSSLLQGLTMLVVCGSLWRSRISSPSTTTFYSPRRRTRHCAHTHPHTTLGLVARRREEERGEGRVEGRKGACPYVTS